MLEVIIEYWFLFTGLKPVRSILLNKGIDKKLRIVIQVKAAQKNITT
jgi:hypothetical protein